jgi:amino acid transporter
MTVQHIDALEAHAPPGELKRALSWKGAFWVAAGVPPLVLFSLGGIAGVAGKMAFAVWMISMVVGFLQSFTYAEMAGMFGNKSGCASIYGATAWLRYSKVIAPLSVWCNWFAWSPVLSLGCAIAAGYILNALFPIPALDAQGVLDYVTANGGTAEDAVAALTPGIRGWTAADVAIPGLGTLHFNSTFLIGAVLMLIIFAIRSR